jgi:4-alpha-glucanotransferase
VWARRGEFLTDVSLGAPPDAFTHEGQSWGLPAYDWVAMDATGLAWIRARAKHASVLYDRFRIDHLVGFFRMWIQKDGDQGRFTPATEDEQRTRGAKVLGAMIEAAGPDAVIGEDLGVIPGFVRETMRTLAVPGYKVIPWERDGNFMPYDPRSYPELSVATWSTHDTPPITGWWAELQPWERERLAGLGRIPLNLPEPEREMALLELLFSAKSDLALVLVNELIGDKSRINTPGTVTDDNWTWRLARPIEELRDDTALAARLDRVRSLVGVSGRAR